jgi:hypothetical protein
MDRTKWVTMFNQSRNNPTNSPILPAQINPLWLESNAIDIEWQKVRKMAVWQVGAIKNRGDMKNEIC